MGDGGSRGYMPREDFFYPQEKVSALDDGSCFAIVAACFNRAVVDGLVAGAERVLQRHDISSGRVRIWRVPGAFELPLVVDYAARCQLGGQRRCDGVIALGAIIRGETPHFDYVSQACIHGLMRVSLKSSVPVACGVVTADTEEQALARAGTDKNRGAEAAASLVEMVRLLSVGR